ncbi:hypothetical protein NM688_g1973 [Phlebia brevispora]|uniref:Uncharacterized protein n=1 Tax=Phlebia brevispora TaxID=194682 RepID=A0ACC1TAL6_9APHY|nr:hypothetical protein NM688_g1973 [Phlebia brevispora]
MSTVNLSDEQLLAHADRVHGSVVIITGAASGIGKEMALLFAKHGAKVVIGDLDLTEAQKVANAINDNGQDAIACLCDVTKWDDQVSLFDLAQKTFGSVDIVIPNAGVVNIGRFTELEVQDVGAHSQASRLINSLQLATNLALHYMREGEAQRLRAIILIGSMASFMGAGAGVVYETAKHGVLGMMRGLRPVCGVRGIRLGSVHPWFADTPLINEGIRQFVAGWPLTPVPRIAATALCIASDPDETTSGHPWLLPDDGEVMRLDGADCKEGMYKELDERAAFLVKIWDAESHQCRDSHKV